MNMDEIPWCKPWRVKGFWNAVFAYGCTSNPKTMYKNKGLGRNIICPHCDKESSVPKYSRTGDIFICGSCGKPYRYKPSY